MKIIPVILSGGSGTRLWPLSRATYPKQFFKLTSPELTLIQQTAQRVANAALFAPPVVVCNVEHRFVVAEQLRATGIKSPTIILEPEGRNTAAALTIAALHIQETHGGDSVMLAMPSDHAMAQPARFIKAVKTALPQAKKGALMTFGITPDYAETGYGYIRCGAALKSGAPMHSIAAFVEKPSSSNARRFLKSEKYVWNSGIFLFSVDAYLKEINALQPTIATLCAKALAGKSRDLDFIRLDKKPFLALPSISVDHAVMEKTQKGGVMRMECGWNDLGSWEALWRVEDKDAKGNSVAQNTCLIDCEDSYVKNDGGPLVAALGVKNLIIVSTKDAVLVADKSKTTDIKQLVHALAATHKTLVDGHCKVYRPWGSYMAIDAGTRYQVKHLTIKPKEKLSLQLHRQRSEHWVVVSGTAKVTLDDKEHTLSSNQSFYIPIGAKHRLENIGSGLLEIIEVQSGVYLGEDDIIRFEDRYGRDNKNS